MELQETYVSCDSDILLSSLDAIATWWSLSPLVTIAIDPYSPNIWPTVWEIIHAGECCKFSRALAMAFNAHYLDRDLNVEIARVYDNRNNDEYMIAIVNEQYVLNTPYGNIANLQDVLANITVKESWPIQAVLDMQEE